MSIRLTTVKSEIHNVLSTVRLTERSIVGSARFESEVQLRDELPIVRRLKTLHEYLLTYDNLEEVDAPTFLEPFLDVIKTPSSNGIVTGIALSSLNKLLLYGSLSSESPRGAEAVNLAVEAVCDCRFEASHQYGDEVVLLQILEVLVSLLRCPVGDRLTEENVWSMVQVCYRMATDTTLSELLRASAANHLSHVILTVFSRASILIQEKKEEDETHHDNNTKKAFLGYSARILPRILAFLAKLTDPANVIIDLENTVSNHSNETLRAMGLQLINIALETAGNVLGDQPESVQIIQNDLCKYLLSNSQTDELSVLALTLRVVYNLFSAMKGHLKVQLEVFLTSVHFRIVNSSSAPNENKELALESLLDFCHDPALVLDLHANYDCDVNCSNLFEGLCKLLNKHALPEGRRNGLTALNVLALEGSFSIASHIAERCVINAESNSKNEASIGEEEETKNLPDDELILRKTHKRRLFLVATQFNNAPTKPYWREYATELGVFTVTDNPDDDSIQIAKFLLTTPVLDKGAIGDFLSELDKKNILTSYIQQFSMKGLRIDLALRNVLECFRIPGEAQKIERVMEVFSTIYFQQNIEDTVFSSADATLIFAFSIVMLHTDRHSRSIPENKRMTEEQFVRNLRGINDGKDFDPLFLSEVFKAVSENEFILSYDSLNSGGVREWDGILKHSSKVEFPRFSKTGHFKKAGLHERDMFEILFDSTLQVVDSALDSTQDGKIVNRALACAADLAKAASYFDRTDEYNQVIILLCRHFFSILVNRSLSECLKTNMEEVQATAKVEIECAELIHDDVRKSSHERQKRMALLLTRLDINASERYSAVRLLLVAKSVFYLTRAFGNNSRECWANIVSVLAHLRSENLLPNVSKEEVTFSSEDQRILSEERTLFESRKNRLLLVPVRTGPFSPRSSISTVEESLGSPKASTGIHFSFDDVKSAGKDRKRYVNHEDAEEVLEEIDEKPSVWTAVASFLFGGSNNNIEKQEEDWRYSREYLKTTKAVQDFFKVSNSFKDLIRSTWNLSEQCLAHLLTALSSPFSATPPSWCMDFSPRVSASCLDLLVLVACANQSRIEQISPYLDSSFSFILKTSTKPQQQKQVVISSAITGFFQVSSLRTTNPFESLPNTYEALSSGNVDVDETEICFGLEENRRIESEDVAGWKSWFRLFNVFFCSEPNDNGLDVMETLITEKLVYRSNVILTIDALASIVTCEKSLPMIRARAVSLFRLLYSVLEDEDDSVWILILATLRAWWEYGGFDLEVTESLSFVLFEGVSKATDTVAKQGRISTAFESILFPLVAESRRRRNEATSLLSRFFLSCVSNSSDEFVEMLLPRVLDSLSADFEDPEAVDDSKESAVQKILNILNVVVVGTEFKDKRMALVSTEVDMLLPSGWREQLSSRVDLVNHTNDKV